MKYWAYFVKCVGTDLKKKRIIFIDIIYGRSPSHGEESELDSSSSDVPTLSEFSVTPTNSLNDEREGDSDEAHSPTHLQKGMATQKGALETPIPFPPTPERPEVSEPGPSKSVGAHYDVKNSIYFRKWQSGRRRKSFRRTNPRTPREATNNQGHQSVQSR